MKLEIKAYNGLWFDCYSSILHTLLNTVCDTPEEYIYINNYCYVITNEKSGSRKKYHSFNSILNSQKLAEALLKNEEVIQANNEKDIAGIIRGAIEKKKIILIPVDMYYWMPEIKLQYHKNHVMHIAFVIGYDDEKRVFNAIEGDEKEIPFEHLVDASISAGGKVYTYDQCNDLSKLCIGIEFMYESASLIIKSINKLLDNSEQIWNVDGFDDNDMDYFIGISSAHLTNFVNRYKANQILFQKYPKYDMVKEFSTLEKKSKILKSRLHKASIMKDYRLLSIVKNEFFEILKIECSLWNRFKEIYNCH